MLFTPDFLARRYVHLALTLEFGAAAPRYAAPPVRLATISEGLNTWPLYVARAKNLFGREGIDVEITLTGSSARQLEELGAGGFDIGFQQSDHIVRAVERSSDLFIFMAQGHAPELSLIVRPEIGSFGDLKGRTIAVDGARSGYALLLRQLLAGKGLREGDYVFREIGGSQERFDALKSGAAVASFLNSPFDRNLVAAGFRSLGTTAEYFPTYPGSIAAARRGWAQRNEPQLVAFIRAFNKAYAWLNDRENKAEAVRLLPARLNIEPAAAARAFDRFSALPRPQITSEGLRQVIDVVWEAEGFTVPRGGPDKYMDLSYFERAH